MPHTDFLLPHSGLIVDPAQFFLVPFGGEITMDITGEPKSLWTIADQSFPDQEKLAMLVWLTADPDNGDDIDLGAWKANTRTFALPKGERWGPWGPWCLEEWFVSGTIGDKVKVFLMARKARKLQAQTGRV